jgi:tRNA threonylcarbamoyladenosine biosynthesis protein TsaE
MSVQQSPVAALVLNSVTLQKLPAAAESVINAAGENKVFAFEGQMGAGKTTFIKALCKAWGVNDPVTSPTFSLVNEYTAANGAPIYHFDFYRLNNQREAVDIGALEYFDSGHVCLIEWPSQIAELLPERYARIKLSRLTEDTRSITLELPS